MKKLLVGLALLLGLNIGAQDQLTVRSEGENFQIVEYSWSEGDNDDGETGVTTVPVYGILYKAVTQPGTGDNQPSDNYDITIKELFRKSDGTWATSAAAPDIADPSGANPLLNNRDNVNIETVNFWPDNSIQVGGRLQIDITNAGDGTTNAKTGKITLFISKMVARRSIEFLDDLGDVTITAVASGEGIKWNGSEWVNGTFGAGGVSDLPDLGDVTLTSLQNGQMLLYNSTSGDWENNNYLALPAAGSANNTLRSNGSAWVGNSNFTVTSAGVVVAASTITAGDGSGEEIISINGGAGANRMIRGLTNGSIRWRQVMGTTAAEAGSNVGSDFLLQAYSDAGAFIDNPIDIQRESAGPITIGGSSARPTTLTGDLTVSGGDLVGGADGATRGTLTLWDGTSNAPGVLSLASTNGTRYYIFADDSGGLRWHTSLPTSDGDGTLIGGGGGSGSVTRLHTNTTLASTTSSGLTTLMSYTMPGGTLDTNDDFIEIEASGLAPQYFDSGNETEPIINLKFGGSTVASVSYTAQSTNESQSEWLIRGRIVRTGAATQVGHFTLYAQDANGFSVNTTLDPVELSSLTSTLSSDVDIVVEGGRRVTGTVPGTALECKMLIVEKHAA